MAVGDHGPLPGAGWYPDPRRQAAYRWWDGAMWSEHVWSPAPGPHMWSAPGGPARRRPLRDVLLVLQVLFWCYAGVWVLLLPAMVISDADNGAFGHDFSTILVPEIGIACLGAVACIAGLQLERRGSDWWKALAAPAAAAAAVVVLSVIVLPAGGNR